MKRIAHALLMIPALFLSGCTTMYVMATVPTDLSAVQPGATRETVEKTLGEPEGSSPQGSGTLNTYEYNRGRFPPATEGDVWRAVVADITMAPIQPLLLPFYIHSIGEQKRRMDIVYGPDGRVVRIEGKDWIREAR
jgi:hypothetical protein